MVGNVGFRAPLKKFKVLFLPQFLHSPFGNVGASIAMGTTIYSSVVSTLTAPFVHAYARVKAPAPPPSRQPRKVGELFVMLWVQQFNLQLPLWVPWISMISEIALSKFNGKIAEFDCQLPKNE